MQTISVINYKGGVGKTSIVANLAAGFAQKGYKVLVIDLDPQASLTFSFINVREWERKYKDNCTIKNWYDAYLNQKRMLLESIFIRDLEVNKQIEQSITLVSSHTDLFKVEIELAQRLIGKNKRMQAKNKLEVLDLLAKEIQGLQKVFDIVLLDCPPSFEIFTQSAVVASDYYLVPTRLDYLSELGGMTLNGHIEKLLEEMNGQISLFNLLYHPIKVVFLGTIATMVQTKNAELIGINKQYSNSIKGNKLKCFATTIRFNQTAMGEEHRIPIILRKGLDSSEKKLAEEFQALLDEVIQRMGENYEYRKRKNN